MSTIELYIYLSQASSLFPIIAGLCYFRKFNLSFQVLLLFFFSSFFFELLSIYLAKKYHNNLPGLHLYTAIEFLVFSSFYFLKSKQKLYSKIILLNTILFLVVALADAFFINSIWKFNNNSRTYACASLVIYSLVYFYGLMKSDEIINLWKAAIFWINVGVLFYFATNLFFFMLENYFSTTDVPLMAIGLYIHSSVNIITNIIFAYSFLQLKKNKVA